MVWARYLQHGFFQPTVASAFGLGRGWGAIWPFFLAAGAALVLAARVTPGLRAGGSALRAALLALAAWGLFAALAPTLLGIDHRGLQSIAGAGDATALHRGFGSYPLKALAPIAACAGLLALAGARFSRREPAPALSG